MSEETNTATAAGDAPQGTTETAAPASEGLSTRSGFWQLKFATDPNKDVAESFVTPMFGAPGAPVTAKVEIMPCEDYPADDSGNGVAVKFAFKLKEPLTSIDGVRKAPGYVWKPRFSEILQPASTKDVDVQRATRGKKTVWRIAKSLGLIPRNQAELTLAQAGKVLDAMTGLEAILKLETFEGSKIDAETGKKVVFQNYELSLAGGNGTGATTTTTPAGEPAAQAAPAPAFDY